MVIDSTKQTPSILMYIINVGVFFMSYKDVIRAFIYDCKIRNLIELVTHQHIKNYFSCLSNGG